MNPNEHVVSVQPSKLTMTPSNTSNLNRFIGGTLIIVGTSMGAGMLALPTMCAQYGMTYSFGYLIAAWLVMTYCAYLLLEVNLAFPMGSNFMTTARATLGTAGQIVTTIVYLLLLFSLLAAYISGGGEILQIVFQSINVPVTYIMSVVLFVAFFGLIVLSHIRNVDYCNRLFMISKLLMFVFICWLLYPYSHFNFLSFSTSHHFSAESTVILMTSFGFAIVIPSLRSYFKDNIKLLRLAILMGSLVPLILYSIWNLLIASVVTDELLLKEVAQAEHPTQALGMLLSEQLLESHIGSYFYIFAAICLFTSFLGVSLALTDFLSDACSLQKKGIQKLGLFGLAFLPPLVLVMYFTGVFIEALKYAGICCVFLHIILPILMVWSARFYKKVYRPYQVRGSKFLLSTTLVATLFLVVASL